VHPVVPFLLRVAQDVASSELVDDEAIVGQEDDLGSKRLAYMDVSMKERAMVS
jgi:hypothetical protein